MRITQVVKYLLLVNLAVFLLEMILGEANVFKYAALFYVGDTMFQFWQPFTYMFLHQGFAHLFFNMFALWMLGSSIEMFWGAKRFLIYYIICGLGAGLVQEICQAAGWIGINHYTVGASGSVFGILLAFGVTFPDQRLFIIPFPFPIKAKYFVLFYAVIELLSGTIGSDSVAHFAHLGGMFFGLILILLWRRKRNPYSYENTAFSSGYDKRERSFEVKDGFFSRMKQKFTGKKKPKMTISYMNEREKDYAYNQRKREENEEIDRILDKIRKGGYASLTETEKRKLFEASKR